LLFTRVFGILTAMQQNYELMIIFPVTVGEDGQKKVFDTVATAIKGSGKVTSTKDFGKRKLAYLINKQAEGNYYLMEFTANGADAGSIDNKLRNNDTVLRYLLLTQEKAVAKKKKTTKEE
jgi:small subunit ribosomal protein S6